MELDHRIGKFVDGDFGFGRMELWGWGWGTDELGVGDGGQMN